jgi:hypothetical protein
MAGELEPRFESMEWPVDIANFREIIGRPLTRQEIEDRDPFSDKNRNSTLRDLPVFDDSEGTDDSHGQLFAC